MEERSRQSDAVDTFLARLDHPAREVIAALRSAILDSNPEITESIKWNAPNFRYHNDDRVTFRIPPKGGLQVIFHRGVKVKDTSGFAFEDDTGLIAWASPDRGIVTLADGEAIAAQSDRLVGLVNRWMLATSG